VPVLSQSAEREEHPSVQSPES